MKTSFTYKITMLLIRLFGVKKLFSGPTVDVSKIRKVDVHTPIGIFWKLENVSRFNIKDTKITAIQSHATNDKLVIWIHGGAFVSGPTLFHWDSMKTIFQKSDVNIWMCDYPKAPETKMDGIQVNITEIYRHAIKKYDAKNIILLGDSAGGTLALLLAQRLTDLNLPNPSKIIAISPVVDAALDNPKIDEIDHVDQILGKEGVHYVKELCIQGEDLKSPKFSVLYGNVSSLPPVTLFLAEHDICFPDGMLFAERLKNINNHHKVIIGKEMPHIWPLLPIMKEAKIALEQVIQEIKE